MKRLLMLSVLALMFGASCDEFEPLDITTTTLSPGKVGAPYADTIRTEGGSGHAFIYIVDGQLPPGIAFRQTHDDGALYGTPLLAGDYLFTVEAYSGDDSTPHGTIVTRGFLLTIQP